MNNLNDHSRGRGAGAGDGNQWYYALLVPMLALAAFRWNWTRESQREIQKVKDQCDKDVSTIKNEMKRRYRTELEKLMAERKQLYQERDVLVEEKQRLEQENWYQRATATLEELEGQLVERQSVYCSRIRPREERQKMEENMLRKVKKHPIGAELDLEADLKEIFKRDTYCADLLNTDKRKNGSLMWVYLKYWQQQVTVHKQRAEEAIIGGNTRSTKK